jgi:hypothetical protein
MDALGEPTLADAILDRLGHHADTIALHGESMRNRPAKLTRGAMSDSPERPGVALLRRWQASPDGGATFPWSAWQRSRGLGGRLHVDCVATFPWIGWQTSVEYAPAECGSPGSPGLRLLSVCTGGLFSDARNARMIPHWEV